MSCEAQDKVWLIRQPPQCHSSYPGIHWSVDCFLFNKMARHNVTGGGYRIYNCQIPSRHHLCQIDLFTEYSTVEKRLGCMDMDNTEPRFYVKVRVFYGFTYLYLVNFYSCKLWKRTSLDIFKLSIWPMSLRSPVSTDTTYNMWLWLTKWHISNPSLCCGHCSGTKCFTFTLHLTKTIDTLNSAYSCFWIKVVRSVDILCLPFIPDITTIMWMCLSSKIG